MIVFENVLQRLRDNGWSAYRLIREKQISNGTIMRLRKGESVSTDTIDTICRLCHCQPGDILTYRETQGQE